VPPGELRRDEKTGRPQLPHENSTYLGRSLFTDYLLPVELGGTLLLVAAVGAIAIAQRRGRGTTTGTEALP
jgi:NADH:ubiquinone oxidoreductase subunit 6 (subunit J)